MHFSDKLMDHKRKYTHNIRVSECYEYNVLIFRICEPKKSVNFLREMLWPMTATPNTP